MVVEFLCSVQLGNSSYLLCGPLTLLFWNRRVWAAKVRSQFELFQCLEKLGSAPPLENSPELDSEADSFWPSSQMAGTTPHFKPFVHLTWAVNARCNCQDNLNLFWCVSRGFSWAHLYFWLRIFWLRNFWLFLSYCELINPLPEIISYFSTMAGIPPCELSSSCSIAWA